MLRLIKRVLTNRVAIFLLLTAFELASFTLLIYYLGSLSPYFYLFFIFLSALAIFEILGRDTYPEYKVAWSLVITCLPGFGFVFYVFLGRKVISKKRQQKFMASNRKLHSYLQQDKHTKERISTDIVIEKCANIVQSASMFPICKAKKLKYYKSGEDFYESLKTQLLSAKSFIFMEYFIIERGKMWNEILEILTKKVKEGVEVRVIYDDYGSLLNLPQRYPKKLQKLGIKAMRFNAIVPLLDARINVRNHRKITVVDGKIAFVSGANLADEYINVVNRFGYWKDCAASFEGKAVNNFTISILQTWASAHAAEDVSRFINNEEDSPASNGYILPYQDSPFLKLNVCHNLYLSLIYSAKKKINITSPYVVLNAELKTALISAAQSGVEVNIIIPNKPDKRSIYQMTKAFCTELLKFGVNIYEYTPGFIHQKTFCVDETYAIVGTSNLDLRSLHTNYECGILVKENDFVSEVEKDCFQILKKSKKITFIKKPNIFVRAYRSLLRIFSPLM